MSEKFPVALKITGLDRIVGGLAGAPRELQVVVNRVVDEGLRKIEERVREIVPVRTGFLRSTIYTERTGFLTWEVGASAFYAGFVEFGTRYMRARPYLTPAISEKIPEIREELKDALIDKILELIG